MALDHVDSLLGDISVIVDAISGSVSMTSKSLIRAAVLGGSKERVHEIGRLPVENIMMFKFKESLEQQFLVHKLVVDHELAVAKANEQRNIVLVNQLEHDITQFREEHSSLKEHLELAKQHMELQNSIVTNQAPEVSSLKDLLNQSQAQIAGLNSMVTNQAREVSSLKDLFNQS
ncbi:hypothetical protein GOP47_0028033 [Adiantum capillus-veneris]|nr:hypothetical protein GOP47_0028033 [Adiantum capillus-veneris]